VPIGDEDAVLSRDLGAVFRQATGRLAARVLAKTLRTIGPDCLDSQAWVSRISRTCTRTWEAAGDLLAALAHGDEEKVQALRGSTDLSWWNVAVTLGILLRDVHRGDEAAVKMVEFLIADESRVDGGS